MPRASGGVLALALTNLIPEAAAPDPTCTPVRLEFAYYCGLYNGLIGLGSDLPNFLGFLMGDVESYDKITKVIARDGFAAPIQAIWNNLGAMPACQKAEFYGEVALNILPIPLAVSKLGRIGKVADVLNALDPSTYIFKAFKPLAPAMRPISKAGQWVLRGVANDLTLLVQDGKYVLQQAGRALDWQVATVPVRDNLGNVWNIARSTADALGTARYTLIEGFETETGEVLLRTATRSGDEVAAAGKRINSLLERIKAKLRIAPHEWSTADIDRFVDDFVDNTDALAKFESGVLDVEAWKALQDRPNLKKDLPTLTAMTNILKNPKAKAIFGTDADLQAAMNKFANTHASSNWSWNKSSMEFHLTLLTKHIDEFQGVDGFDKSIKDAIYNSNGAVQDGFWHGIKATEAIGYKRADVKKFDMEFDELLDCGSATNPAGCKFDLELNGSDPKYVEFKSYSDPSQIPDKQFMAYLSRLNNLSEMKYIFNKTKLTVSGKDAKIQMKAFLKANASNLYKAVDEGGIGLVQCEKLFGTGVNSPQKLISKLETEAGFDEILKFVESK